VAEQNRYIRAREQAGLSTGQAARLLGVAVIELTLVENAQQSVHSITSERMADLYGCAVEWLTGQVPYLDYAAVDRIPGARDLPFRDRDWLAELLAARPRRIYED
jgi:transcriptional regulator with XRE-family HTH domain